jgi:hypothetical protein
MVVAKSQPMLSTINQETSIKKLVSLMMPFLRRRFKLRMFIKKFKRLLISLELMMDTMDLEI